MVLISKRSGRRSVSGSSLESQNHGRSGSFTHVEKIVTCSNCRQTRCRICTPGGCRNCRSTHINRYTLRC